MSSFRTEQNVYRKTLGEYVSGVWVEGEELPLTIMASVQPATLSDYDRMQSTLAGRRVEAMIRLYSDTALIPAGADFTNGDEVEWFGTRYLVIAVSPWRSNVIPHYRMMAVKVLES